jgi:hypothetical protein
MFGQPTERAYSTIHLTIRPVSEGDAQHERRAEPGGAERGDVERHPIENPLDAGGEPVDGRAKCFLFGVGADRVAA